MSHALSALFPNGRVWAYAYDPFGRRVSKETNGIRHDFLWDGDVIAREVVNGQAVDWFFEPRSFRPLARLENGALSYVVNDHLGTPKEVLSLEGALLWSSDHDTWGSLRTIRAAFVSGDYWTEEVTETLAETASITFCPIRFQGQWEDAETGLYQNRFRYYDPVIVSYLSRDPIGLFGGTRQAAYVINPNNEIDALGLQRTFVVYRGVDQDTGLPYIGCASAVGNSGMTPAQIISGRYSGDFSRFGGTAPVPLWTGTNRNAARGLEQYYFEQTGGVANRPGNANPTAANRQNPVGPNNANRSIYRGAAQMELRSRGSSNCCANFGPTAGNGSNKGC